MSVLRIVLGISVVVLIPGIVLAQPGPATHLSFTNSTTTDVVIGVVRGLHVEPLLVRAGRTAKLSLPSTASDRALCAMKATKRGLKYHIEEPIKILATSDFNASEWPGPVVGAFLIKDENDEYRIGYYYAAAKTYTSKTEKPKALNKKIQAQIDAGKDMFEKYKTAIEKAQSDVQSKEDSEIAP